MATIETVQCDDCGAVRRLSGTSTSLRFFRVDGDVHEIGVDGDWTVAMGDYCQVCFAKALGLRFVTARGV